MHCFQGRSSLHHSSQPSESMSKISYLCTLLLNKSFNKCSGLHYPRPKEDSYNMVTYINISPVGEKRTHFTLISGFTFLELISPTKTTQDIFILRNIQERFTARRRYCGQVCMWRYITQKYADKMKLIRGCPASVYCPIWEHISRGLGSRRHTYYLVQLAYIYHDISLECHSCGGETIIQ